MQADSQPKRHWKIPEKGFEVRFVVSSDTRKPEEITELVGIQPSYVRYAKDEVRRFNLWYLEADPSLETIQDHVNDIVSRIEPHAAQFANLKTYHISLDVYLYPETFEKYHHDGPGLYLDPKVLDLLHSMHAAFNLD